MAYILVKNRKVTNISYVKPIGDYPFIEVEIPEPEVKEGKEPVMMYDGEIYYEWEELPIETEIIEDLTSPIYEPSLEERIRALEVMELERILGGGF